MAGTDDLAPLLTGQAEGRLVMGQAVVTSWNPSNNTHTLSFRDSPIEDVGVLHGVSALGYQSGDVVLLLGWVPEKGTSTWWILGRALIPGQDSPDLVVRGSAIIVDSEDGIEVSGGGSVSVDDGGAIRARYDDGTSAIVYGSLVLEGTSTPDGHGLLIQDDVAGSKQDIFRAKRNTDGSLVVWLGEVTGGVPVPIDEFATEADETRVRTYNGGDGFLATFDGGNSVVAASDGGDARLSVFGSGGDVRLTNEEFRVFTAFEATGDPVNCHISDDGQIMRNTSSRRFKKSIQDAEIDADAVLRLRPRTWLPNDEVFGYTGGPPAERKDGSPEGRKPAESRKRKRTSPRRPQERRIGFVAEELDEIGLGQFVEHFENGEIGSVAYDRLTAALVTLCQRQQGQLDALTAWALTQGFQPPQAT